MWVLSPTEVTATGVGKVRLPASEAILSVTLASSADDAKTVDSEIKKKVTAINSALTEVEMVGDVSQSVVNIVPAATVVAGAKGYQGVKTMTLRIKDVNSVGEVIAKLYDNGASVVSQPIIGVENEEVEAKAALEDALANARANLKRTVGPLRIIRKVVDIQQASTGSSASLAVTTGDKTEVEVSRAVSVVYRVW